MAKTHAERQREYREKKKLELGDVWNTKETARVKKCYKATDKLSRVEKEKRRERNRINSQKYRERVKNIVKTLNQETSTESVEQSAECTSTSDANGVSSTTSSTPLIVKLPLSNTRTRKRTSRAVSIANRRIKQMEAQNESLKRRLKASQKQCERLRKKSKCKQVRDSPRSKVDAEMRQAGVSPMKSPKLRRNLLLGRCLVEEVAAAKNTTAKSARCLVARVASGKIIKKYRMTKGLSTATGMSRNMLTASKSKALKLSAKTRMAIVRQQLQTKVTDFSRTLPGKADAVKGNSKGQKIQKHVLNDYLKTLHLKFAAEYTDIKLSFASFCKMRPKHIALVNYGSRVTCLCVKHQNFALKLKTLKTLQVTNITSPDKFVETYAESGIGDVLNSIGQTDTVTFKEWKRVTTDDGKQRMKIIDTQVHKQDFADTMMEHFKDITSHVKRVKNQYTEFRNMKENLFENHVLIQMDFAENYSCQSMEEIQSAYWNQKMVTLHPVCPDVTHVHYWTDSPTSQYRNRSSFDVIYRHFTLFGCHASWHFFESGHGKGACDGIGGVAKRMADNAVKTQKTSIQSAGDFYSWAKSTSTQIAYFYVDNDEFNEANHEVQTRQKLVKPVKGTMKVHSVAKAPEGSEGHVMTRDVTCTCPDCFDIGGFKENETCGWNVHKLNKETDQQPNLLTSNIITRDPQTNESNQNTVDDMPSSTAGIDTVSAEKPTASVALQDIHIGSYVCAMYDDAPYIGHVIDVDDEDNEVHVNFMQQTSKQPVVFKWPKTADKIWMKNSDIVFILHTDPMATGKTRRMFRLSDDDETRLSKLAQE